MKQWLITKHRRSLFLAGFYRALGIQKALVDGLPKCQLFFFFLIQGRVRFSLHPPPSCSPKVVIASQGNLSSLVFLLLALICLETTLAGEDSGEELRPDLLLSPREVLLLRILLCQTPGGI